VWPLRSGQLVADEGRISDDLLRRAIFGQLSAPEREWLFSDELMVEFGDLLRATITRIQMQIEQFHRRSLISPTSAEDEAWLVRSPHHRSQNLQDLHHQFR